MSQPNVAYRITIERVEVTTEEHSEWTIIDERPFTKDEARDAYWEDARWQGERPALALKRVYGYTLPTERPKVMETLILQQTVQDLDLAAVVKAINKL